MNHLTFVIRSSVAAAALLLMPRPADAADPTTADCLQANNSSVALRNDNKLRAARDQLLVCAAKSCPADIRKECLRLVDEVNVSMPTIIFEAKDAASGADISAVTVSMDGQPLVERLEGTAVVIDPGSHTFRFETAGQPPVEKPFVIHQGEKGRLERIAFGEAPPPPPPQLKVEELPPPLPTPSETGLGTQKILAIVAGGVGVAGVGLGSVFGFVAISKKNDAQKACPDQCIDQSGVTKWSDAKTAAQVADVAFIVGGVALAGGAVLWFTAKHESRDARGVAAGIGPGSLQLKGIW
jgi:hypothetical protein